MGLKFTENIYAWILLIRAWSFGHIYLEEDEKMQLFLWVIFILKYLLMCLALGEGEADWEEN